MVRHPTFIHAVHETACLRMPAYRPLSYNVVRIRLLTAKRIDVEKKVEEKLATPLQSMASRFVAMDGTMFRIDLY